MTSLCWKEQELDILIGPACFSVKGRVVLPGVVDPAGSACDGQLQIRLFKRLDAVFPDARSFLFFEGRILVNFIPPVSINLLLHRGTSVFIVTISVIKYSCYFYFYKIECKLIANNQNKRLWHSAKDAMLGGNVLHFYSTRCTLINVNLK